MSIKIALTILLILTLCGTFLVPVAGCNRMRADGEQTVSPSTELEIPLLDTVVHESVETAYFALGWFWGADSRFGSIEGVIRTRVGYGGGTTANPTYYDIGNHSETVQVDYNPTVISYEQLLAAFWSSHDPTIRGYPEQYRPAIFYTIDQQKILANESKQAEETKLGKTIYTAIEPYTNFYVAEDYHQKYYLRNTLGVVEALFSIYPNPADFRDSTAVARLNGYVGGYGDLDTLQRNLDTFGLSESGKKELLQIAESGLIPGCPVVPTD